MEPRAAVLDGHHNLGDLKIAVDEVKVPRYGKDEHFRGKRYEV
jgi:hypothetical protein